MPTVPNTKKPDVKIGSFQRPDAAPKTAEKEVVDTPNNDRLKNMEVSMEAEARRTENDLKPIESYEDTLKAAGISKVEANNVIDDVLMKGFYSERIPITSRISCRLRTRNYSDTLRVNTALEVLKPSFTVGFDEIIYRYNLAASLETLADTQFKFADTKTDRDTADKFFEERLKFIETLPEMTVTLLYTKLQKFDTKIRTILKEGAIENF